LAKRKNKRQANDRLSQEQKTDSVKPVLLQKLKIEHDIKFEPIVIDQETGNFQNVHLFEKLLPVLEGYSDVFADDFTPSIQNYPEWLEHHLSFARSVAPWLFAVIVDGAPQGLAWAYNWEGSEYSAEIGGMAKRGTPVGVTTQTIQKLVSLVFEGTKVYIVRSDCAFSNRAGRLAMTRAGLSHPEQRRAWRRVNGQEVTGIIKSVTRSEWEARCVQQ
jgi:hypothetical protein